MLFLTADHAGYELKEFIRHQLATRNVAFEDYGTFEPKKEDSYVSYATKAAKGVIKNNGRGILICGSGVGMSIVANRHRGIRAALCWNKEVAFRAREEDDVNVLVLPARLIDQELAWEIVSTFLSTTFSHEERYKHRLNQIDR